MKADVASCARVASLDVLRCACTIYIVGFWHLLNYATGVIWYHNEITYRLTILVLALFTLLSGYSIGKHVPDFDVPTILRFYNDRFWRLYPPLAAISVIFLILKISSWNLLTKNFALVALFWPPAPSTLWFINMICIFYLLTPLIAAYRPSASRFAGCVILILTAFWVAGLLPQGADHRLFIYFPSFAAGIFLSRQDLLSAPLVLVAVPALTALAVIATLGHPMEGLEEDYWSAPWALTGSVTVLATVIKLGKNWKQQDIITKLSTASLFMYLLHRPIYKVAMFLFPWHGAKAQLPFLIGICLPTTAVLSWHSQRFYDTIPSRHGLVTASPWQKELAKPLFGWTGVDTQNAIKRAEADRRRCQRNNSDPSPWGLRPDKYQSNQDNAHDNA